MNRILSFALLFFIHIALWAQSSPLSIVPFKLEKSGIYIRCQVNGSDSLTFLFDTGANGSVINEQSIQKVKLKIDGESVNTGSNGTNTVKSSSDNSIQIGHILQSHISFTIIPYETTAFDGVMGTDLMRKYIIEIDYSKKQLCFYDPKKYNKPLNEYNRCKLYFPGDYFSIKSSIRIQGKKYKGLFGLDTGADNVLTTASPFSAKNKLSDKTERIGTSTSQGSDGSVYESPVVIIPEIGFAHMNFYQIVADIATAQEGGNAAQDKAGFYGNDFLKRFDIVIDMPHKNIYFKPNHNLYKPFFE